MEYDLDERDWALIEQAVENRQMSVIQFSGSDGKAKLIGDFVPVVAMHEDRKEEVIDDYRAVMQRFSGALKKLKP